MTSQQINEKQDYWTVNGLIKPDPWVVCAANRNTKTGRIICGARHWDEVMRSQKLDSESFKDFEQGFINQFCEFLTREEAWEIGKKNGQIKRIFSENQAFAFSENFY